MRSRQANDDKEALHGRQPMGYVGYGALRRSWSKGRNHFWKLRVAQDVWRGAPVQNSKLIRFNGYLRVAQDRWRGAPARELV
ncbi:hypothetical protein A2U01_0032980, partial [Trifolium medium]|nr:hypothetical protein [Trifolium medium]